MAYKVLQGDVREQLENIAEKSIQTVITSPPYFGLRDYGTASWEGGDADCDHKKKGANKVFGNPVFNENRPSRELTETVGYTDICGKCGAKRVDKQIGLEDSPEAYVQNMVEVFRGVRRILRDDGCVWINLGDSYASTGVMGGQGKTGCVHGTKLSDKQGRAPMPDNCKPKDLIGIPWLVAFALRDDGWYLRSAIPWLKGNSMPESVTDRPSSAVEYFFLFSKSQKYFYDVDAVRKPVKEESRRRVMRGSSENNKYVSGNHLPLGVHANTMSQPRVHRGYDNMEEIIASGDTPLNPAGRNRRNSDWFMDSIEDILEGVSGTLLHDDNDTPIALFCNPQPYRDAHFATFSPRLITPMVLAGSSPKACECCGSPWERLVDVKGEATRPDKFSKYGTPDEDIRGGSETLRKRVINTVKTTGWQPTCTCDNDEAGWWRIADSECNHELGTLSCDESPDLCKHCGAYFVGEATGTGRCKVLDIFAGSGTTLWVAEQNGRDSIGIELNPEYVKLINERMDNMQMNLFMTGLID